MTRKNNTKQLTLLKDQRLRAVYVRLPHRITNKLEVEKLFSGDFEVKLFRQASRHCCVVFSSVEEKVKNVEAVKDKLVDGKHVVVTPVQTFVENKQISTQVKKKVVMPDVKEDAKITQTLFISNVKCGTKTYEIKQALEGCASVTLLKPHSHNLRCALARMETIKIAADYLNEVKSWPVVRNHKLILKPDTRTKHKKHQTKPTNTKTNHNKSQKKVTDKNEDVADTQKCELSATENHEPGQNSGPLKLSDTNAKTKQKLPKIKHGRVLKKSVGIKAKGAIVPKQKLLKKKV